MLDEKEDLNNYDYEPILKEMLDLVPNTVDKREGSIIYDTLAPCAFLIAQQNYMLSYLMSLLFVDTAESDWLDTVCKDFNIYRKTATYAVRRIDTFDSSGTALDIPTGSRFAINDISFAVSEKINTGQYKAVCEQVGTIGNLYSDTILPVDNINNLGSAKLIAAPFIAARDSETDEELRERFYQSYRKSPYGGNIADYEEKVLSINGVGAVKVFPAHVMGEAGKVGIVIGDTQGNTASDSLVEIVQNEMGVDGCGIAPIGHTVTVKTSTDIAINITAEIKIKTGTGFSIVKPAVEKAIEDYINDIGFTDTTVFFAKLQAKILDSHSDIVDIGAVTINGLSKNLALSKTYDLYQVPVVGTITVTEVTN